MKNDSINDYKTSWHNCEIFSPGGSRVGICSKSRHMWYIKNNLADEIGEKTIKLKFKPNYRNPNEPQKMIIKKTRCVVCGIEEDLKKFHIVPSAYKKYFPIERRSHVSNDIVLLCEEHLQDSQNLLNIYHDVLKEEYKIKESDFTDEKLVRLKGACISYLRCKKHDGFIPEKIIGIIMDGGLGENYEKILEYSTIDTSKKIDGCSTTYEYIAKCAIKKNLSEFIMNWKEMFAENLDPKFLDDDYYDDIVGYV